MASIETITGNLKSFPNRHLEYLLNTKGTLLLSFNINKETPKGDLKTNRRHEVAEGQYVRV